jgi:uncharacterized membrane protein YciS (DUF1049 family)
MTRSLRLTAIALVALLLIAVGAIVGLFLVQNAHWIIVRVPFLRLQWDDPFPLVEYETPLYAVMAVAFVAGFLLAMPLFLLGWLRRSVERGRERRMIRGLEGELVDLRNLPVTNPAPLEDEADAAAERHGLAPATPEEEERALLAAALQEPEKGTR